jgi:hypothetical protein
VHEEAEFALKVRTRGTTARAVEIIMPHTTATTTITTTNTNTLHR